MKDTPKARHSTRTKIGLIVGLSACLVIACQRGGQGDDSASESAGPPRAASAEQGKKIYNSICIACHDADPNKDRGGSPTFGPDIADSSYELLRLRVLETTYPEGYEPKRQTRLMTRFPLKESQLRDLHAFLQESLAKGGEAKE